MTVLELGCGTGHMWLGKKKLIDRCGKLILSDISEGMLEQAKITLRQYSGIDYRRIDIQCIPFGACTFDVVIANMMLYHVPDLRRAMGEVWQVLKADGTFYCATYGEHGMMEYLYGLLGILDRSNYSFTLQNGAEQLGRFFSDVQRYDYPDSLEVTEVDDAADYIASLTGMTELRCIPREKMLSVLKTHMQNGILRLPKEYGLLIASGKRS